MPNFKEYNPQTKTTLINIGDQKPGRTAQVIFNKTSDCPSIKKMIPDCGCSAPINLSDRIVVNYTPGQLAEGVIASGQTRQEVQKGIVVKYDNGAEERIYFKATVSQ